MRSGSEIYFPGWVGVGVVGLCENIANSASWAGLGLSLAKTHWNNTHFKYGMSQVFQDRGKLS